MHRRRAFITSGGVSFGPRQFQPPDSSPASVSSGRGLDRKSSEQHLSPVQHAFTECQPLERGRSLSPRSINTSHRQLGLIPIAVWTTLTAGQHEQQQVPFIFSPFKTPPNMRHRPLVFHTRHRECSFLYLGVLFTFWQTMIGICDTDRNGTDVQCSRFYCADPPALYGAFCC